MVDYNLSTSVFNAIVSVATRGAFRAPDAGHIVAIGASPDYVDAVKLYTAPIPDPTDGWFEEWLAYYEGSGGSSPGALQEGLTVRYAFLADIQTVVGGGGAAILDANDRILVQKRADGALVAEASP